MRPTDYDNDPMGLAAAYNSLTAANAHVSSKHRNVTTAASQPSNLPMASTSNRQLSEPLQSPSMGAKHPSHLPQQQSPREISTYVFASRPPAPQYLQQQPHPPRYQHHFPQSFAPDVFLHSIDHTQNLNFHTSQPAISGPNHIPSRAMFPLEPEFMSNTPAQEMPSILHPQINIETPAPMRPVNGTIMSPASSGSVEPSIPSTLSSPFMAKAIPGNSKTPGQSPAPLSQDSLCAHQSSSAGGEMDRIRSQFLQEQMEAQKAAETRRPDYLRRSKRAESDLSQSEFPELDDDGLPGVGITESPTKGRRLKLFQETSEESFEESLMAGGYGLYRTAEWQRPSLLPESSPHPEPSPPAESPQELAPPSEKELRKRRRLEAFKKTGPTITGAKLVPIHLEGMGRVIFDINTTTEEPAEPTPPEPTPKKRGNRRKKKGGDVPDSPGKGRSVLPTEPKAERPNWPDEEFPWKIRRDERADMQKTEKEDRLRCIERFLDRDTDDEDGEDEDGPGWNEDQQPHERTTPFEEPHRGGSAGYWEKAHLWSQSNRADARAALLSKKSIRALQRRRSRSEDGVTCLCGEPDDDREMVQCDACRGWYHLDCIGIRSIQELGPEEEPWFCEECVLPSTPPSATSLLAEPTFVPTDTNHGGVVGSEDLPFFHLTEESPGGTTTTTSTVSAQRLRAPTTPVRGSSMFGNAASTSRSSWAEGLVRNGPRTPRQAHTAHAVRTWQHKSHTAEDEDFDPTSTPSRGIRVQPFHTPKGGNLWSMRWGGQAPKTPSKRAPTWRHSSRTDDTLHSGNSLPGGSFESLVKGLDDSPIQRVSRTNELGKGGRRLFLAEENALRNTQSADSSVGQVTSDLRRSDYLS